MENDYYYKQMIQLNELMNESNNKKTSFFQHILLVSSSILGIILSLHTVNSQYLYIRLIFIISAFLLLIGTLCMALVLYDFSHLQERARQSFHKSIEDALKNDKKVQPVFVKNKKRTSICEIIAYSSLTTALCLLVLYNILISF